MSMIIIDKFVLIELFVYLWYMFELSELIMDEHDDHW